MPTQTGCFQSQIYNNNNNDDNVIIIVTRRNTRMGFSKSVYTHRARRPSGPGPSYNRSRGLRRRRRIRSRPTIIRRHRCRRRHNSDDNRALSRILRGRRRRRRKRRLRNNIRNLRRPTTGPSLCRRRTELSTTRTARRPGTTFCRPFSAAVSSAAVQPRGTSSSTNNAIILVYRKERGGRKSFEPTKKKPIASFASRFLLTLLSEIHNIFHYYISKESLFYW